MPVASPMPQAAQPVMPIQQPIQPIQPMQSAQPMDTSFRKPIIPYTQPTASVPVVTTVMVRPKKKKTFLIISCIVIFLLLATGFLYAYASGYFVSVDKVMAQSFIASHDAKTGTFNTTLTIDISGLKKDPNLPTSALLPNFGNTFTLVSNGSADSTDENNPKIDNTLSFSAGTVQGALELRVINGTTYLELTKAPDLGILSLSPFENKWFSLPAQNDGSAQGSALSSLSMVNSNPLNSLTQDEKDHITQMAKDAHFITITKHLSPEIVNGTLSYHFMFDLDRDGIKAYLQELGDYIHQIGANDPRLANLDVTPVSDAIDNIKIFSGEAWIGIFDHLPQKLTFTTAVTIPGHEDDGYVNISGNVLMSNWNKPVIVAVPPDSVSLETFISNMFSSMNPGATSAAPATAPTTTLTPSQKTSDATKQALLSNMRAQAELFYDNNGQSYNGVCSSGGQSLLSLAKNLPANTNYKCKSSNTAWVASANLSANNYFCVDSVGDAKTVSAPPSGFQCL